MAYSELLALGNVIKALEHFLVFMVDASDLLYLLVFIGSKKGR